MTACSHRTTVCVGTPAHPFLVWPTGIHTNLCPPCTAVVRSMGVDLREDTLPEWRRRLTARDMTRA